MLCFGQPSPLWCILLSPQGFATLRGPHLPRPETLRTPGAGLDDAYKVPQAHLIRPLLHPNKMRRRHLESVSAALYGRCLRIVRIQPQLSGKGVLGHSPKRVLVWGPRRDARPAGERRSGGALEGYPKRKRGDPTWSATRDAEGNHKLALNSHNKSQL